jgi:uncharacterized protein YndB with AHSA1/START domain
MHPFLRSPAIVHLLILAIPPAAVGLVVGSGLDSRTRGQWFLNAAAICLVAAFFSLRSSKRLAPKGKLIDERGTERQMTRILISFELLLDTVALLLAMVSPAITLVISGIAAVYILVWSVPRVRGARFSSSCVIHRSPEVVFAFVSDERNQPQWCANVESVEMLTTGPIGRGTRFRGHSRQDGFELVGDEEIVDYEPNHRFTERLTTGIQPDSDEWTFEAVEGGTRMTHRFNFEWSLSTAALMWYRYPAASRSIMANRQTSEMQLRQILESSESARPALS